MRGTGHRRSGSCSNSRGGEAGGRRHCWSGGRQRNADLDRYFGLCLDRLGLDRLGNQRFLSLLAGGDGYHRCG